jgi:K+-transporting ATPase ATPase C chain
MTSQWIIALRATIVTIVLTGLIYPLAVTGLAQILFPRQAGGSLVKNDKGSVVGSALIGQPFSSPGYFQPRPSAAGDSGYDPTSSSGSNLGPTSAKLRERAQADLDRLVRDNPAAEGPVPAELVMASGSGLDPHLSPRAAMWQARRVAQARSVSPERIEAVVKGAIEERDLGILGEPRVNVLLLNLALDRQFGRPAPVPAPAGK